VTDSLNTYVSMSRSGVSYAFTDTDRANATQQ